MKAADVCGSAVRGDKQARLRQEKISSEVKISEEEKLDFTGCPIMGQMSWGFRQALSNRPLEAVGGFESMELVQWTERFVVSGVGVWEKKKGVERAVLVVLIVWLKWRECHKS